MKLEIARALSVGEQLPSIAEDEYVAFIDEDDTEAVNWRNTARFNSLADRFFKLYTGYDKRAWQINRDASDLPVERLFIPSEGSFPELIVDLRGYISPAASSYYKGLTTLRATWMTYEGDDEVTRLGWSEYLSMGGLDTPTPVDALEPAFANLENTFSAVEALGRHATHS